MNTDKKNQHYIPKFYLKNFSFENNKKQLGIYNLKSSFYFQKSKLKTQGSKNFFYGKDGEIEDSLSEIEGIYANLIHEILNSKKLPFKGSLGHLALLSFIVLTDLRNPIMIGNIKNFSSSINKHLSENDKNSDLINYVPEIPHNYAVNLALDNSKEIIENIFDLDFKLIINQTETSFISSDFPIVKYNQFLENKNWSHVKVGYVTVGLQIFLPISPTLGIVFFDPNIYKVGFKRKRYLEISNKNDIDSLNTLQIINCLETLYFNENIKEDYIRNLVSKSEKFKKANQSKSELSHLLENDETPSDVANKQKNLIILGSTDCETKLRIEGIKILSRASSVKLLDSVTLMRELPKERLKKAANNS